MKTKLILSFTSQPKVSSLGVGAGPGGLIGWLATPSLGLLRLENKKEDKTITEAFLSRIVPILFCQVIPPFKNPVVDGTQRL